MVAIVTSILAKYGTPSPVGAQLRVIAARAEREESIAVARWATIGGAWRATHDGGDDYNENEF